MEPWRERVDAQRCIGRFGQRFEQLRNTTLATFDVRTLGAADSQLRAVRRATIAQTIENAATPLFRSQLSLLRAQAIRRLRRGLLRNARAHETIPDEEMAQELRKVCS
jgi:hypothetical protein